MNYITMMEPQSLLVVSLSGGSVVTAQLSGVFLSIYLYNQTNHKSTLYMSFSSSAQAVEVVLPT